MNEEQETRTFQIMEAYGQLHDAIDGLELRLDTLSKRLYPVLNKNPLNEECNEEKSHGFTTPFASDLLQKVDQIQNLNRILDELISRLEI